MERSSTVFTLTSDWLIVLVEDESTFEQAKWATGNFDVRQVFH